MSASKPRRTKPRAEDELRPEYQFDYHKAKPNRFAGQLKEGSMVVVLDPEIAAYFKTPEAVNTVLKALVKALPQTGA
ncbi:MAG: hypothetical protein M1546_26505 [Chloroflexi bacterium]|nr:hypothetical protein [Chloroflexota bacterium]